MPVSSSCRANLGFSYDRIRFDLLSYFSMPPPPTHLNNLNNLKNNLLTLNSFQKRQKLYKNEKIKAQNIQHLAFPPPPGWKYYPDS